MKETLTINVNLELAPETLNTVVQTAKQLAGADERGRYNVDTHEVLSRLLSRFLADNDFSAYAGDAANYD